MGISKNSQVAFRNSAVGMDRGFLEMPFCIEPGATCINVNFNALPHSANSRCAPLP